MNIPERQADFQNLLDVLACKVPKRPVLFELFLNVPLYERLAGYPHTDKTELGYMKLVTDAYARAGYDYVSLHGSRDFGFVRDEVHQKDTISLNEGGVIHDRKSFDSYPWPDPAKCDFSALGEIEKYLPQGMKVMVIGPGGVLENAIALVGYDNLCFMLYEDEALAEDLFTAIGQRIYGYYEQSLRYDSVGVVMVNDDWGFNTQTFLSPAQMRKYVFPWHKKIVQLAHDQGRPAILHSCGNMTEIMEDVIEDLKFDGRHSYEDGIVPVEEAYKRWGGRIAILGGMDVDFLIRSTPEAIRERCKAMLNLGKTKGGYALGSGNSIPTYIPQEHYFEMIRCALE